MSRRELAPVTNDATRDHDAVASMLPWYVNGTLGALETERVEALADCLRDLREVGEHVAPPAEFHDLADDVAAAHRVERLVVDLDEHAQRRLARIARPQSLHLGLEARGRGLRDRQRARDATDGPERCRHVRKTIGRDRRDPQLQRLEPPDRIRGRAGLPGQDEVGPEREQPLRVHAPAVSDSRQVARGLRIVAVLDRAHERIARARRVGELREMRRQADDAQAFCSRRVPARGEHGEGRAEGDLVEAREGRAHGVARERRGDQGEHGGRRASAERDHAADVHAAREDGDEGRDAVDDGKEAVAFFLRIRGQIGLGEGVVHTCILTPCSASRVPISRAAARLFTTTGGLPDASKRT